ncbi:M23 family metallopeptidase [Treponema sp.]|uniref:M23 family metallopeptidase n=1 Tax=Treponema sp. TaxID=166 RepID=UPI00298E2887|nr:M23 family metallopeptidase [Treponema sp.]MCQ2240582.1 M23 family metallopeptidase [Treponema sp.]
MKKFKLIFTAVFIFITTASFARQAAFNGENYTISLNYNETASPGDAVFVRMKIARNKSVKTDFSQSEAKLELFIDGKSVRSSDFYTLGKATKAGKTMLTGIPLSSWWTNENKCFLKITYSIQNESKEFTLPFNLDNKSFISETIRLNESNTAIKTDTSTKRMEQISKLNTILETINPQNVYSTKAFVPPVDSTRRTSYFADRRVFQYTTGNSSTSLHLGIDYGVPTGTEVRAPAEGKVVMAENRISTGWSVVIEHLPGLYSLYYHMNDMKVKEGDTVKTGTLIGHSGSTGLATGPHLHWEVRLNLEAVSPDFFTTNFAFEPATN